MPKKRSLGNLLFYTYMVGFAIILTGLIGHVVVSSLAKTWFGTPLPDAFTFKWYQYSLDYYNLKGVMVVTLEVAVAVVVLALLVSVPAAYVFARKSFRGKNLLMAFMLLPMLVPQMTYGIPLATVLYRYGLGGQLIGVILANLVPTIPFGVFVLTPFIEQINQNLEASARALGANGFQTFRRVLLPLMIPGVLSASVLILVNTIANFELTFLVAGAGSQTLVVALFYAVNAAGLRPTYSIDAMAVIYTATVMALLAITMKFASPTQAIYRLGKD